MTTLVGRKPRLAEICISETGYEMIISSEDIEDEISHITQNMWRKAGGLDPHSSLSVSTV